MESTKVAALQPKMHSFGILLTATHLTWCKFAEITSIHGLKFIMDKQGNIFTRSIWVVMTLAGFIASNLLVDTFWDRYKSNPTRLSVESAHVPLNLLPIPAVTICQINRIDVNGANTFINKLTLPKNITKDMVMEYIMQTAGFIDNIEYNMDELQLLEDIIADNNFTITQASEHFHQSCENLLVKCRWENEIQPCENLFEKSMSYHGSCCTFKKIKWTRYFQIQNGLSIAIAPPSNVRSYSSTYSEGVKMLIHESSVYPSDLSVEKMISHRSESIIRLTSIMTKCSVEVEDLSLNDRECLFKTERNLKYFEEYEENNCDVECRIDKIIESCGCVPYYFNVVAKLVPTCNVTDIQCLVDSYFTIHESRLKHNEQCRCPRNCDAIVFDAQTNRVPFIGQNYSIDQFYNGLDPAQHLIVHIIFGKQVFKRMHRDLLTNIVNLAAGLGGIYSLFIGMSFITFFEIIYFFTIRLWSTYCQLKNDCKIVNTYTNRIKHQDFHNRNQFFIDHK